MINRFSGQYNFLSNMHPCIVKIGDEIYPSAEHAFQAMKCLDKNDRLAMSVCRSPEEAKKAGRLVNLRPDWEKVKLEVMYNIVKAKFNNESLRIKLKGTGDEELVEGNTWGDKFWGVCNGQGRNELGKILMRVREEI